MRTFATEINGIDSVAQLVEQMTLNHWVESSSLSGVTQEIQAVNQSVNCFFYFCPIVYLAVCSMFADNGQSNK